MAADAGLTVQTPSPFGRNEPVGRTRPAAGARQAGVPDRGRRGRRDRHRADRLHRLQRRGADPDRHPRARAPCAPRSRPTCASSGPARPRKKRAEELLAKLKEKPDIDALAQQENLKVEESTQIGRAGAYLPNLGNSPDLKEAAFRLTEAAPVAPGVYDVNGDAVMAVLAAKVPADETRLEAEKKPACAIACSSAPRRLPCSASSSSSRPGADPVRQRLRDRRGGVVAAADGRVQRCRVERSRALPIRRQHCVRGSHANAERSTLNVERWRATWSCNRA